MSELIKREDLENWLRTECYGTDTYDDKEYVIGRLRKELPTIDAVPVVRCKDCIHLTCTGWCGREFDWYPVDPDDFCSKGARMDGERRES